MLLRAHAGTATGTSRMVHDRTVASTRSRAIAPRAAPCLPAIAHNKPAHLRLAPLRASSNDFDAVPTAISVDDAYKILGVSASVPFESVLDVKNKLLAANASDREKQLEIEAAYDVLFMQSMRRRVSGDVAVPGSVRYADVPKKRAAPNKAQAAATSVLQKLPAVSVRAPNSAQATTQAAVFGTLATWALLQALLEPQEAAAADVAGWQLALAAGYAVYSFKDTKRMSIGKALGITSAALLAGALVGGLVEGWLRVDIVPIGGFSSAGVLVAEFAIFAVWAACTFVV